MQNTNNVHTQAVIYARYSSHGQSEQSIEGQLHECHDFAQREGYTVVGEYIDRAMTGRNDDRPDFQRMLADAPKKQFAAIIVWKLDRFARNRYDSAINKAKLKKHGVKVVSAKENITDSPEGIILEGMLESMAEYYSANLSVNIRRGQRETIAKGKFCGGRVPFGYKLVDGRLVADELRAPIMRSIFEQYAAGVTKSEIIADLNRRGVKSTYGASLTLNSFYRAMVSPTYTGRYMHKGEEVPGLADRIIDDATFAKVQERLKTVAHAPAASKATVEYLLRGKAFCGHCGGAMVGESGRGKSGTVYHYYTCTNRKKLHTCKKANEKKDFAEWYVVEQTVEYVLTPANIDKIAKAVVAEYNKEFGVTRVDDLQRAIDRAERELNNLVDTLAAAPKATHARIYAKMESLEAQKVDMELDIAKLRIAQGIRYTEKEVTVWLNQFCTGDLFDLEYRRRIIDTFINAAFFYDDRIVIFYNIKGGKQVSYMELAEAMEEIEETFPDDDTNECSDLNASAPPSKDVNLDTRSASFLYPL